MSFYIKLYEHIDFSVHDNVHHFTENIFRNIF